MDLTLSLSNIRIFSRINYTSFQVLISRGASRTALNCNGYEFQLHVFPQFGFLMFTYDYMYVGKAFTKAL